MITGFSAIPATSPRCGRIYSAMLVVCTGFTAYFLSYAMTISGGLRGFLGNEEMITIIPSLQQRQIFLGASCGVSCFSSSLFLCQSSSSNCTLCNFTRLAGLKSP